MSTIPENLREQMLAAIDAPMTDLEAIQTVVAMFEMTADRIKSASQLEQLNLLPLLMRAGNVIEHLQQRLDVRLDPDLSGGSVPSYRHD